MRSNPKQSMNEFYANVTRYVTYVTARGQQMTLAVYAVHQGTSKVGYITRCLGRIAELCFKIEVLYLD